jgi:hypothetical protein
MKESELRLGNWYMYANYDGIIARQVKEIKRNQFGLMADYDGVNFEICRPIALTEDWLLKFGFKKKERLPFFKITYLVNYSLEINPDNGVVWLECMTATHSVNPCVNIKYVHQLQNLYFALTGEELEIKK